MEITFLKSTTCSIQTLKSDIIRSSLSTSNNFRQVQNRDISPINSESNMCEVEEVSFSSYVNNGSVEEPSANVLCFPLSLSIGDISEPFSDERADFLQSLMRISGSAFAHVGRELMASARTSLERLRSAKEPVRIWYSDHPDELCGFCHLMALLPRDADVRVVKLPEYEVLGSELRRYSSWGDLEPEELRRFLPLERLLSEVERCCFAGLWSELRSENGPLRAVVNGRLCTVGEDFYDNVILRELHQQPEQFSEAHLIGSILGRYDLGISDWLLAWRIEEFISRGMLTPITEPEENCPIYHRFLRKEACL